MTYQLTCDCGEVVKVEAPSRQEAIKKIKGIMNADAVKQHMKTKHPGQPMVTVEQAHANIDKNLKQVS